MTVGMYGGKFLIVHKGHVNAMIQASTMVDELHVIVSYDEEYEKEHHFKDTKIKHVPFHQRLRWWKEITKDMNHVFVHAVEEKQTGQFSDWEQGAIGIKKAVGKHIDFVFSSEHEYGPFFEKLYEGAKHIVIDADRAQYNISATKIRKEGAVAHWNMLPTIVRPYFAKSVVVVGTESCGKSTLVRNLATIYNTSYVKEFGRTFYENIGAEIVIEEDFPKIAFEHKYHEEQARKIANKLFFVDTEAIVTQYFSIAYLDKRQPVLDEIAKLQKYDLWLFLEPDVKWVDDGTRAFGEQEVREKNNEILKSLLDEHEIEYISIQGNFEERLSLARSAVDKLF